MAEYIDREKARDAVYARIDELKDDEEFNMAKEICIIGVKKYIKVIPTANVVEREKIDKAIAEIHSYKHGNGSMFHYGMIKAIEILEKNIGENKWKNIDQRNSYCTFTEQYARLVLVAIHKAGGS